MKWVETIVLRSINMDRTYMESALRDLADAAKKESCRPEIHLFRRALIDNDFCIYLVHETSKVTHSGSELGLRIVSALNEFGLVNHTIWIEVDDGLS